MSKLCIDQGNSSIKVAVFDQDDLRFSKAYQCLTRVDLQQFGNDVDRVILSSVVNDPSLIELLTQTYGDKFIHFTADTPVPLKNCYSTPRTLGTDRLAAAVGANYLKPNEAALVVDAGSAITYDVVSADGEFLGGNIAPGVRLRFASLHDYTSKLPLVQMTDAVEVPSFGTDTNSAIFAGVIQGIMHELDGYVDELQQKLGKVNIFLTGGDAKYFVNRSKNCIFAEDLLVQIGLNRILDFNS